MSSTSRSPEHDESWPGQRHHQFDAHSGAVAKERYQNGPSSRADDPYEHLLDGVNAETAPGISKGYQSALTKAGFTSQRFSSAAESGPGHPSGSIDFSGSWAAPGSDRRQPAQPTTDPEQGSSEGKKPGYTFGQQTAKPESSKGKPAQFDFRHPVATQSVKDSEQRDGEH